MAISSVGYAAGDGTTITIPAGHQNGDLLFIYSFRSALTAPTNPAGWSSTSTASSGATSYRVGWKIAGSSSETSGTWTNATGLICHVYRGVTTKLTQPFGTGVGTTNTGTTVTYSALSPLKNPGSSWVVSFGAIVATTSTIKTAPSGMTNEVDSVGATVEYVGHDTNGTYTAGAGQWPSTNVSVGTSAEWRTFTVEVFADQGLPNNFQFFKDNAGGDTGVMAFTEKIR